MEVDPPGLAEIVNILNFVDSRRMCEWKKIPNASATDVLHIVRHVLTQLDHKVYPELCRRLRFLYDAEVVRRVLLS